MHAVSAANNVPLDVQAVFTNGQNLVLKAEAARQALLHRMTASSGNSTPLNLGVGAYELDSVIQGEAAATFIQASALASVVVTSPQFITAAKILTPLIAKVRELEQAVLSEAQHVSRTMNALEAAREAATDKAMAALEKDPSIVKARKELAALVPDEPVPEAPPFRGRVPLPA